MKIFVVTKKMLVAAACVLGIIILALIVWICFMDGSATAPVGAQLYGEYERTVLAGQKKEVPIYNVARDDNKIALTIDAA